MENQEIDKGFWIDGLRVPDKDGKVIGNSMAGYQGRIKVSLGKPKQEFKGSAWKMEFKTVLPEHIHEKLKGKTIERIRDNFKSEPNKHDYDKFAKTVTALSLERLIERYDEIIDDYLWVVADEIAPREKMIYIKWNSKFGEGRSSWNGAKMGKIMSMQFNFFVGYHNGKTHFDIDFKMFNHNYDKDIEDYKRIPWTQDREDFFEKIYVNFESLRDKLDGFFASLNVDTIETHMSNFKLLN